jgi:hypothetical protein
MSKLSCLMAAATVCLPAVPASAAALDLVVRDSAGKAVPHAVIMVDIPGLPARNLRFPWPYVVTQRNIQFTPFVLIVPVGAQVSFPNQDKVRHHVYSFSKAKRFELKLYGRDEHQSVLFDKPGPVPLGCNIHDSMAGFIMVVDTPFAAQTDASGRASLPNLPAGNARLRVWHPYAQVPGGQLVQPLAIPASGVVARAVNLNLRWPSAPR